MITAHFSGDKIFSTSEDAFALFDKSSLGEKKENKIEYTNVEALFLVGENKMQVHMNNKSLQMQDLIKKLRKKDKKIETKFIVFKDLRKKGYIVKTALKFGAEFRVYDKGIRPGDDHARWILFTVNENESLKWHDFAAKNRIAHSTKKSLLIALVDEEGDISYYEINWLRT